MPVTVNNSGQTRGGQTVYGGQHGQTRGGQTGYGGLPGLTAPGLTVCISLP